MLHFEPTVIYKYVHVHGSISVDYMCYWNNLINNTGKYQIKPLGKVFIIDLHSQ